MREVYELTADNVHVIRQKLQIIISSIDGRIGPEPFAVVKAVREIDRLLPRPQWMAPHGNESQALL